MRSRLGVSVCALAVAACAAALGGCASGSAGDERPSAPPAPPPAAAPPRGERPPVREAQRRPRLPRVSARTLDRGRTRRPRAALTFDADMTAEWLARIRAGSLRGVYDRRLVRYLRRTRTPATIFVTGLWARHYPGALRSLARDPLFEIGNHTYTHRSYTPGCFGLPVVAGRAAKRREVTRTATAVERLTGERTHWFRFPGLCHDRPDVRLVAALGQQPVDGDVLPGDPQNHSPEAITRTVLGGVRPGSIVVMHLMGPPEAPSTAQAVETIVPALRRRGYRLVRVGDLLRRGGVDVTSLTDIH